MFMLGPKPLSVYDQQLKHGLGYPNPYTLKQAISQCPKLYLASSLGNSEISLNVRDTEDTLDDASKSQQKRDIKEMKDVFESTESELYELEKQNDFLKDQLLEVSLKHEVELFVPYNPLSHEEIESSTMALEPSNVKNFHQVQPSTHIWTKDHPLDQVIGDPSKPFMTRANGSTQFLSLITWDLGYPKDSGFELIAYSDALEFEENKIVTGWLFTTGGEYVSLSEQCLIIMGQQQHAVEVHPDELCPPNKRYDLMDANKKVDLEHFWHTLKEDGSKYRLTFMLDKKELSLNSGDIQDLLLLNHKQIAEIMIAL
ncbi:hypothetical protein Tco_1154357 [Tanacetum coccineum]